METKVRFIIPQFSGEALSVKIYEQGGDEVQAESILVETSSNVGVFDGTISETIGGIFRYVLFIGENIVAHGLIELYDTDQTYLSDTDNVKPKSPLQASSWNVVVVAILRSLIGDMDPSQYTYTDDRLIQSFVVCANLVLFDLDFNEDYKINVQDQKILPDPTNDGNFITLGCLKTACVLLTSENKSAAISGCKISMKDGPSTITMDKSELVKSLQDIRQNVCQKYEEAAFLFKQEGTLGVAIFGPHGVGLGSHKSSSRSHR